ncbi:zinc peptidase [Lactococcus lactis]|uniref:zinc peptidase n=1 Tax=Lactococcus lactis TaxID=1358 RepID=UPI001F584D61|nr:zinc peptidase [Lactococcus lactis]
MNCKNDISLEIKATIAYFDVEEYPFICDGMKITIKDEDFIFIKESNSYIKKQNILLHEQGHCYYGHTHLNCHSFGWSNHQEHEADMYMLEQRIDEWLSQYDWFPDIIDVYAFLDYFELDYRHYNDAYNLFKHIISHNTSDTF